MAFLGALMPWVDPELLGPNVLNHYLFAYVVLALPSLLLTGGCSSPWPPSPAR
jgi:ABC-2 type transport system permease protein